MVRPTFIVYDNKPRFDKHVIYNGNPLSRATIKRILLPEHGAFWFYTDITKDLENVDIHSPYVHLFPGVISTNTMQFKKDPIEVTPTMLKYNPKTGNLEVKNSIIHFLC